MGDILKLTLYDKSHQKYFESEVPADNERKILELLKLAAAKGLKLRMSKKDDEHVEWW